MRPASLASAASMRWLNLSCMACSLLRRSAERHRIAVSPVSGQRTSLTSMPSRISRQPLGCGQLGGELAQLRLGRADDVAPPGLTQPRQVLRRWPCRDRRSTPGRPRRGGPPWCSTMVCTVCSRGCCRRTPRSPAGSRRRSPPGRCRPACSRADDRGSSRAAPADWPSPRPRSRCWSRRTAAPRSRPRTARRSAATDALPARPCAQAADRARDTADPC